MSDNKTTLEEDVFKNVLSNIGTGKEYTAAPSHKYIEALKQLGLIEMGWDNSLTPFGRTILDKLNNNFTL